MKQVILLATVLLYSTINAQPVYDGNGQAAGQANAASMTMSSFSVPAGNKRLLVVCARHVSATTPSATFAGTPMTLSSNGSFRTILFTHVLGDNGSPTVGDIVISGADITNMGAKSYNNVDQSTPVDNTNTNTGSNSSSATLSITSETNDLVCDCLGGENTSGPYTFTQDVSQTQTFHNNTGLFIGFVEATVASSQKAGSATVSMSWTMSSSVNYAHAGMNLNNGTVLPVKLVSFEGKATPSGVQLTWETASELNNSGFYIERSTDGQDWEAIGFEAGNGTTTEMTTYYFMDETPLSGIAYYRLKQVDFDGTYEYSEIITIRVGEKSAVPLHFYPSPARTHLMIENAAIGDIVQIFSIEGQFVRSFTVQGNPHRFDLTDIVAGTYFIKAGDKVEKLIIIK